MLKKCPLTTIINTDRVQIKAYLSENLHILFLLCEEKTKCEHFLVILFLIET